MKTTTKVLFLGSILFFVKCSSLPKKPGEAQVTAAKTKWENVTLADLSSGHTVYTTKCNKCHALKEIEDYNQEQWTKLIDVMAPKAELSDTETDQLRKYIYAARETEK